MMSVTCFDDLPDLVLIELFSYLSSTDILWGLTRLNRRLTMLITERGFFHHINLSVTRYEQFNKILHFLPLNDIQSLVINSDASPLQLTHWPYLPRLTILCIIGVYNYNDLTIFILLHAATITHLIIKSNGRIIPDGLSIKFEYPRGDMEALVMNILLIHLPALRFLDYGLNYQLIGWSNTVHVHAPLTYLRLALSSMDDLVHIISTQSLCSTLRQLHVSIGNGSYCNRSTLLRSKSLRPFINLHTFTFYQKFFSLVKIEWTVFEMVISLEVMPVLRLANVSIFITINDLNRISSSSLFTDHRRVDVHFAFNLIDYPHYIEVTPHIPRGNRFHPRDIVGATFVVNHWCSIKDWPIDGDPFNRGPYYHHMWYTLPWKFDNFFHQYLPIRWITKIELFEIPPKLMSMNHSSLRSLDAAGQNLASCIFPLPHVVLSDCIETLHLSYYNSPIRIDFSTLRNISLLNSTNCLTYNSLLPTTVRSVRILLSYLEPNYMLPDWSAILYSLSNLLQLNSLRIFMYDLPRTVDDNNCQIIAKMAVMVTDFGFCFRSRGGPDENQVQTIFKNHVKFIKQLCNCILLLPFDNPPHYSIDDDDCGLTIWF